MEITVIILFIIGLALLIFGAEILVRGASRLAALAGISPLAIGLTVVAFGTSSPEIAVTIRAGVAGQSDLALGNVVGSNVFNILFILGLSAALAPLVVSRQLIILDVPILIGISFLTLFFGLDNNISRWEGGVFVAGVIVYTANLLRLSRRENQTVPANPADETAAENKSAKKVLINILFVIGGLGLLVLGADWLVKGAVVFARVMGVSELIIGLTIVAAGTSLPEIATSVIASLRGERDIAVGNIIGSNIFNILVVLGLAALFAPAGIHVSQGALRFDIPVMIAAAVACLPIFFSGHRISRWEGVLFLAYYIAYVVYLYLEAARHEMLPVFSTIMLEFVIPLTIITGIIILARRIKKGGKRHSADKTHNSNILAL